MDAGFDRFVPLGKAPVGGTPELTMLCYASHSIPGLDQRRLRSLIQRARAANMAAGITGCLVFDGRRFLQVIEGRPEAVTALFERIEADPRHERVSLLWQGAAQRREFPRHPMACYNLAWRRMRGLREPQAALNALLTSNGVRQADIVSLAELFRCLRLPGWPEAIAA